MKNQYILAAPVDGGLALGTARKPLLPQLAGEAERARPGWGEPVHRGPTLGPMASSFRWWGAKWFKEWERLAHYRG